MIHGVIADDMNFEGEDNSGKKNATRYMVFSCDNGDSSMLLAESNLVPKRNDVHPVYTRWSVESVGAPVYDAADHRFMLKIKYKFGGDSGGGNGGTENISSVEPWLLGAQNVKITVFEKEKVIDQLWNPDKNSWVSLINTAGNKLLLQGSEYVLQLSFTQNYKHTTGKWREMNSNISINDSDVKVCNLNIKKYSGLLKPFLPELHTVYENDGKTIKWEYESINYTIEVLTDSNWLKSVLNVGRLARFERKGELTVLPEPVFSYTPWKTADDTANMQVKPVYGGITDVQAAQIEYQKVAPGKKIPYSQIDEDLPLKEDGTLYLEAMENPDENPYLKIEGFTVIPESWAKYGLPRSV